MMSTFGGRMSESNRISIDRFTGINLTSTVFFLSHCHQDHMIGLGESNFAHRLEQGCKLYCHSVTKELLLSDSRYTHLAKHIETIEVECPQIIDLPDFYSDSADQETVTVTFLPAGHCPGSVMMLFEFDRNIALYTGDFRLNRSDLEQMAHLHNSNGEVKPITTLYFDSTFCTEARVEMPSRNDSLEALISLVKDWLDEHPNNKVFLQLAAKYGHEYLLNGLCKELEAKCHVSKAKYATYSRVTTLKSFTTDVMIGARIHACSLWEPEPELPDPDIQVIASTSTHIGSVNRKQVVSSCPECPRRAENVMIVKPSMMWFSYKKLKNVIVYKESDRFYRLLYSFHSSLEEVRAMIEYLRPSRAYPCAIPEGSTAESVMNLISDLLPSCYSQQSSDSINENLPRRKEVPAQLRLDDILPTGRHAYLAKFDSPESDDEISLSPVRKRFKWTWNDSFVLKNGQKQRKEEEIVTSDVSDIPVKPLIFDDDEQLDLKLNASSSTPRSSKVDQSSRLDGTVEFDHPSIVVAEKKESCDCSNHSSQNASFNGSNDMWDEEDEFTTKSDPLPDVRLDTMRQQSGPSDQSTTPDIPPTAASFVDDSVSIIDPPAPAIIDCITLDDSPLLTIDNDDDDDDVQCIGDFVSPSRRCSTTSVVSTADWLCAKKRLL